MPSWKSVAIGAGAFKAKCLQLMDEVQRRRIELVITKHGRPVAKLVPVEELEPDAFGSMRGTVVYHDDIISPDHEAWRDVE